MGRDPLGHGMLATVLPVRRNQSAIVLTFAATWCKRNEAGGMDMTSVGLFEPIYDGSSMASLSTPQQVTMVPNGRCRGQHPRN